MLTPTQASIEYTNISCKVNELKYKMTARTETLVLPQSATT